MLKGGNAAAINMQSMQLEWLARTGMLYHRFPELAGKKQSEFKNRFPLFLALRPRKSFAAWKGGRGWISVEGSYSPRERIDFEKRA